MQLQNKLNLVALSAAALWSLPIACGSSDDGTTATGAGAGAGATSSTSTMQGGGAATGSGSATAGSGGSGGAIAKTVSDWLGTNVSGDLTHLDITYQLNGFDTPAA